MKIVLGTFTALAIGILVIAGLRNSPAPQAASQSAPTVDRSVPLYAPDPEHLWNRLDRLLRVRTAKDGREHGLDALDPLLWRETKHLLVGSSHEQVLALLDSFLEGHADRLVQDPVKRILLQRDVWAVFDWAVSHDERKDGDRRDALASRLARVIRRLALTPEDAGRLAVEFDGRNRHPADPFAGLADFVHAERQLNQFPGLAVVVVRTDGTPRVFVSGDRRIGQGDPITPSDRMHLGSLTKAITATVIGALVEKGRMTFETTIGQTFPELSPKMQPAYRTVTARQLLTHAAGLPTYGTNVSLLPLLRLKGTPREQRYAFVERVLAEAPRFAPGSSFEYSNAGAPLAGAMAERITDTPYRQLVEQLVFRPIGARAAFGNPGLAAEAQPWGHKRTFFGTVPVLPSDPLHTTPLAIEPAGDASPSLPDYGRFLQLHLRGLRGRDDGLKSRTILKLHGRPTPDNPRRGPAMGWTVMPRDGGTSHEHRGSYGAYVAFAAIQPSRDVAVGVFTNLGGEGLRDAVAGIALRVASRFEISPSSQESITSR